MTFPIVGTILATDFLGTLPGDTFTLTVVTDGFGGLCTVANGHLLSVTGSLDGTPYDITLTNLYPASPTFNPATGVLTGQGSLPLSGPFTGAIFTYDLTGFTIEGEDNGASGVFVVQKKCLQ